MALIQWFHRIKANTWAVFWTFLLWYQDRCCSSTLHIYILGVDKDKERCQLCLSSGSGKATAFLGTTWPVQVTRILLATRWTRKKTGGFHERPWSSIWVWTHSYLNKIRMFKGKEVKWVQKKISKQDCTILSLNIILSSSYWVILTPLTTQDFTGTETL